MTSKRLLFVVFILYLATVQATFSKDVRVSFRSSDGSEVVLLDCNVEIRKKWVFEGGKISDYEYEMAFSTIKHAKEIYNFCEGKVGSKISVYLNDYLVGSPVLIERIGSGRLVFKLNEERASEVEKLIENTTVQNGE